MRKILFFSYLFSVIALLLYSYVKPRVWPKKDEYPNDAENIVDFGIIDAQNTQRQKIISVLDKESAEKIWNQALDFLDADANLKMPEIVLATDLSRLHDSTGRILTALYNLKSQKVTIFLNDLYLTHHSYLSYVRAPIQDEDFQIAINLSLLHEFLHHIFTSQNIPYEEQHQRMLETALGLIKKVSLEHCGRGNIYFQQEIADLKESARQEKIYRSIVPLISGP